MSAEPIARFDGCAVWASLTEEQREEIGSLALELVVSQYIDERLLEDGEQLDPRVRRVAARYEMNWPGAERLHEAFVDAIPRELLEAPDGSPRIPSTVGPICRECGCTEEDACPGGCGWAEDDLCTACVAARPNRGVGR